ncbi:DUF4192 domain-containing protein [Hoyosella sp. YIM 151337]|uniref:DUF4192 domain-containing protein n=1 Tax=Hoyosella sp. YIM 151337 TaxID=2992742 RepID=UPI002236BE02|nr:DUF4192 domain-containing protein [Hoyosella sp. YIM 151337]MCW4353312.1 DUF4192 domain-containing protein [Hoyosella sp. YIM 151337]
MTPHHVPPAPPADSSVTTGNAPAKLRLTHVSDLLGALPALLGYYPEESIVVMCMGGPRRTDFTGFIRADVPFDADGAVCFDVLPEVVSSLIQFCDSNGVNTVLLAVISDTSPLLAADITDAVIEGLECAGISVGAAYMAPRISAGERWRSELPIRDEGVIADPRESAVAAELVAAGRMIRPSRSDLVTELECADEQQSQRIAKKLKLLPSHKRRAKSPEDAHHLERVLFAVSSIDCWEQPGDEECVALAEALLRIPVRDCVFALALTDEAEPAERLWTVLTRYLPEPARAEAATLLAHSAYVRGDGTLAGVALDIALGADSEHRMARLLDTALRAGTPPNVIAEIATIGWQLAEALGVTLPPLALPLASERSRHAT